MVAEAEGLRFLNNSYQGPDGNLSMFTVSFKSKAAVDISDNDENPILAAPLAPGMSIKDVQAIVTKPCIPNNVAMDVGYMRRDANTGSTSTDANLHDLDHFLDGVDVGTADGSGTFRYSSAETQRHKSLYIEHDDVYLTVDLKTADLTAAVEIEFRIIYEFKGTK